MYDFSKEVTCFHEEHVRLTNGERGDMKRRRDTNHDRIVAGLKELGKPALVESINQGGYAQKTMTQPPEADEDSRYDIDLGVVFEKDAASGPRTTRGWVRDAIACKATNLKNDPEVKPKCVRVIYAEGYQCDFPVFRRTSTDTGWTYELAAGEEWVASDPRSMNTWVDEQVSARSPEASGSYQLRRIIRLLKFFAKVHAHRRGLKFPGGLVATALAVEAYRAQNGRDDLSFRETLRALSYRSEHQPVYANGTQVSDAKDVDRIKRLVDEAKDAVQRLDALEGDDVTDADARKAWRKVFRHSYFDEPVGKAAAAAFETKSIPGASGLAAPMLPSAAAAALSDAERADRVRAAAEARKAAGAGERPWAG